MNRMWNDEQDDEAERLLDDTSALLFADENGAPLPMSDDELARDDPYLCVHGWSSLHPQPCPQCDGDGCYVCGQPATRIGEDDLRYCDWCYDSTGQDPGALNGIDPEN